MSVCTVCGGTFTHHGGVGRPPKRCETCRAVTRSDDVAWRKVRALVLAEEPFCATPGCGQPSTTVDHIVPLARGGSRLDRDNLQGMCGPCNFAKGARMAEEAASGSTHARRSAADADADRCECCGLRRRATGELRCVACEFFLHDSSDPCPELVSTATTQRLTEGETR